MTLHEQNEASEYRASNRKQATEAIPDQFSTAAAATVDEALTTRRSIRAFLDRPVPRDEVSEILRLASYAPSGSNFQPWRVYVLTGAARAALTDAMHAACLANETGHQREYRFYMDPIEEPYLSRRRACGWGLYGALGIARHEKERLAAQRARNYLFFDAPVGMIFTLDQRMERGSYVDYGMFLQSIALAARSRGLHTCPQAAIAEFPDLVRQQLGIGPEQMVLCGMALGYADPDAVVNQFRPKREPVDAFATFLD
jgi:nitroreductase